MELELLKKGIDCTKKKRTWVFALGALSVTGYGAYRVYHLPTMVKKRRKLLKLLGLFVTVVEMISDSAEAIGVISKDLKEFVQSDTDQIPKSLNQIFKITKSDEFSDSVIKITTALTVGICQGYRRETGKNGVKMRGNSGFSDKVLDKLFSKAGCGFASVVVGSFARNLVMAYYGGAANSNGSSETGPSWMEVLCEEKYRTVIGICVQSFVGTAVAVYLDKTMHMNTYDEFFTGLTNPNHEKQVRDMLVSICNGAVETLVKTSHHVLTNSDTNADDDSKLKNTSYLPLHFSENSSEENRALIGGNLLKNKFMEMQEMDKNQVGDWLSKMSSTLAVSSNKRFVLDVTGRVTLKTVTSFLKFLLEKIAECLKKTVEIIREQVVEKGVEAFKYMSRKSSAIVTICLSLCLHMLNSPWILVPIT